MLGDEAWLSLFPRSAFARAEVFPSFNVHDLHTVDDGIGAHLEPLLRSPGAPPPRSLRRKPDRWERGW